MSRGEIEDYNGQSGGKGLFVPHFMKQRDVARFNRLKRMLGRGHLWLLGLALLVLWTPSLVGRVHGDEGSDTIPSQQKLSIRFEDASGRPVPQIPFTIVPIEGPPDAEWPAAVLGRSGNNGAASALLPSPATYRITFSSWKRAGDLVAVTLNDRAVEPPVLFTMGSEPVELKVVIETAGRVSGAVSTQNNEDLSHLFIDVLGSSQGDCYQCWPVVPDGTFEFATNEFPVTVRPHDPEGRWAFEPESISVSKDGQHDGLLFVATRRDGQRLRGRVVDRQTGDPLAGAKIIGSWACGDSSSGGRIPTDQSGVFDLPCSSGCAYRMDVIAPAYLRTVFEETVSECDEEITVQLDKGERLFGTIVDKREHPVAGLPVWAKKSPGTYTTITDDNGTYEFTGLPVGSYLLMVNDRRALGPHRQWVLLDDRGGTPSISLIGGATETRLDAKAVQGGTLCISVRDHEYNPLKLKGPLRVFVPDGEKPVDIRRAPMRVAQEQLCSRHLAPGHYLVMVGDWSAPFVPTWWPGEEDRELATPVRVEAGKQLDLGPMFVRPAGRILAALEEPQDLEMGAMRMELQEVVKDEDVEVEWSAIPQDRVTVADGTINLRRVPTGRWNVRLCARDGCQEGKLWRNVEPVEVRMGETSSILLRATSREPG